jgi:hypothetical protein
MGHFVLLFIVGVYAEKYECGSRAKIDAGSVVATVPAVIIFLPCPS